MHLTHLVCTSCGREYDAAIPQNVSACCSKPLYPQYDLAAAARTLTKDSLKVRVKSLWRYREVLPVRRDEDIVHARRRLHALLPAHHLGAKHGLDRLFMKDEALNRRKASRRAA